ncbi:MAG: aminotransferase class I/II-fold pyridoxal phosphate-dependent enzyme [Planctomycetaceae bacterium]
MATVTGTESQSTDVTPRPEAVDAAKAATAAAAGAAASEAVTPATPPFKIQLAERILKLPPYVLAKVNALRDAKRRSGQDVIDLGMGNPSEPPQDIVIEKLMEAARDPDNHGYSKATGITNLKREVSAKYFKKFGVRLDPESEVIVTIGSKEGFSHMMLALVGPGDTAIIPAPFFPAHKYAIAMTGASVLALEVENSEKFLSNIAFTCESLSPAPKVVVFNYPHNPSSVTIEPEFWVDVVKLARKYNFMVISDFAYADVAFDGYVPPSFLAAPGAKDVGVEFTTMSKGYNMAGWRCGFCAGNPEMVKALGTIKGYYDYGLFQAIQIAAIVALRHTDAAVEAQSKLYQSRRDLLLDGLRKQGWEVPTPRAGMFVWGKIPEPFRSQMNSVEFAMKMLEEANVALSPGSGFGNAGEGFCRMALVENENRLKQALRQMGRVLDKR